RVAGELKDRQADRWIIDLRSNPGGYLGVALDLAGYFAGDQTAVQFKNKNTGFRSARGTDHGFIFARPAIVLTDRYSASASEILAACVQDYGQALLLGERTYGKGTVQGMYGLTGGGKLKLTIDRFYSPQGKSINETGVSPDWELADTDQQLAAELLLTAAPVPGDNTGYVQVAAGPETFTVDLALARTERYWPVWAALLATRQPDAFKTGTQTGWQPVDAAAADQRWPLFYPGYRQVARMNAVPPDKQFTVTFSRGLDFATVNAAGVELIAVDSGSRVPLTFLPLNDRQVKVAPDEPLAAGGAYWLLVHRVVTDVAGRPLNQGVLALITVQG
ncbi:MAG: S41 family peptidase, partial [Heliobacteriaceae bacterium]|nr:S41 family peptidase [Heliobacteriaceae bacterium]